MEWGGERALGSKGGSFAVATLEPLQRLRLPASVKGGRPARAHGEHGTLARARGPSAPPPRPPWRAQARAAQGAWPRSARDASLKASTLRPLRTAGLLAARRRLPFAGGFRPGTTLLARPVHEGSA